jgi:hypothetical protein
MAAIVVRGGFLGAAFQITIPFDPAAESPQRSLESSRPSSETALSRRAKLTDLFDSEGRQRDVSSNLAPGRPATPPPARGAAVRTTQVSPDLS